MGNMHISLFGKLSIYAADQTMLNLQPRRAEELLCYLLLYRNRLHEREKLATLLWPDLAPAQSKRYLRQLLWQLQSALNHTVQPASHLLHTEHDRLGINQDAAYQLDIQIFETAFASVVDQAGRNLCVQQVDQLRQAIALYQGDLLEGWYQDWCILERDRLQNMYLAMLDKLLGYSEAHHAYEAGLTYGVEILRYDRAREQTHRQLMRLYYLAGNRTAALHQFEMCAATLREELDVVPTASTVALYQQISNEQLRPPALSANPPAQLPPHGDTPTQNALQQLEQIQISLGQLQAQVSSLLENLRQTTS
ncbi:MAG: hypothetical protein DYG89_53830 [Caldilinea sp. CFX5]|nr:hypothetical protein [Caldilinea sp. CFX5]